MKSIINISSDDNINEIVQDNDCIVFCTIVLIGVFLLICIYIWIILLFIKASRNSNRESLYESLGHCYEK
jgi:hypothetical protein